MWIITVWLHFSPEVTMTGFKKCCISNAMDRTDGMLWNGSKEDGNVRSMKEPTMKMERVKLIQKSIQNLTMLCVFNV